MITLLNDYYRINNRTAENDDTVVFDIALLSDYHVYAGHFPDNPVSPGVCNIQMIKECVAQLVGKRLFLAYIAKCRFSAVLTPKAAVDLQLRLRIINDANMSSKTERTFQAHATLFDETTTYIEFKGEFTAYR